MMSSEGSVVLPVAITHRASPARFRPLRVSSPLRKYNAPSIHAPMIGMTCGRPSGRMVASQYVLGFSGFSRRS